MNLNQKLDAIKLLYLPKEKKLWAKGEPQTSVTEILLKSVSVLQ